MVGVARSIDTSKIAIVHVYRKGRGLIGVSLSADGNKIASLTPHKIVTFYLFPGYHVGLLKQTEPSVDKARGHRFAFEREGAGSEMPPLEHLIYASVAVQKFEAPQLAELLQQSRSANERRGLTGMLLHTDSDGSFFQVLEGEPASIDQLFERLLLDKRHSQLTTIIREPIVRRSFEEWTMGFSSVSPERLSQVPGLNDFFREGSCFTELDAGRAKKLLSAFAEGRWRTKLLGATWTPA